MKQLYAVIIFLMAASIFCQNFYHESEVKQGGVVTFVISPVENHVDYTFTMFNNKGTKILEVKGFNYYLFEDKAQITLGLGGIPADLPPGRYLLKAEGIGIIHSYFFERFIDVKDVDYLKSVLKANDKMDNLVNGEKDPEREVQSLRLWDAISSFSPYILYEENTLSQPVSGRHSSPFGFTRVTIYPSGKESVSYHKGEDLAAPVGTAVLSDGGGRIILAENRIVTGNTIVIEHLPGVQTIYYHMDSINVIKGDIVKKGTKIGEVGTTGFSTGPHLHWEVRFSTVPVDPKWFIEHPLIDKIFIMNMISSTNKKRGG